jgi:hypothetical protein
VSACPICHEVPGHFGSGAGTELDPTINPMLPSRFKIIKDLRELGSPTEFL